MDKKIFWTTKSPLPEFHAITFAHPAMSAPFRLVANQFAPVTLSGFAHTPAPMTIQPPDQSASAQPKLRIAFPRAVVGREFKRQLKLIVASGLRTPITATYAVYLGDTDTPQVTWSLYVSDANGVAFTKDTVQVTATDDNPMLRAVAPIYDPADFTGLELI